jgi:hypothetical protein
MDEQFRAALLEADNPAVLLEYFSEQLKLVEEGTTR